MTRIAIARGGDDGKKNDDEVEVITLRMEDDEVVTKRSGSRLITTTR